MILAWPELVEGNAMINNDLMMLRMTPAMLTPSMRTPSTMNSSMSLGSSDSDIAEFVLRGLHSCLKLRDTLIKSEIQKEFYGPKEFDNLNCTHFICLSCVISPAN